VAKRVHLFRSFTTKAGVFGKDKGGMTGSAAGIRQKNLPKREIDRTEMSSGGSKTTLPRAIISLGERACQTQQP
jgi:hypothetical protein